MIDDKTFDQLVKATMNVVVESYEGTLSTHGDEAAEFVRDAMVSGRERMRRMSK